MLAKNNQKFKSNQRKNEIVAKIIKCQLQFDEKKNELLVCVEHFLVYVNHYVGEKNIMIRNSLNKKKKCFQR